MPFFRKPQVDNPEANGVKNVDLGSGKPLPRYVPHNERFPVQATGQTGWENGQRYAGTRQKPQMNVLGDTQKRIVAQSAQSAENQNLSKVGDSVHEKKLDQHL
ncbi:MAG: hypothetical protein ACLPYS_17335 [Vulcanimicrobiaceae bacterium]